ncbi:MAG: HEAT repeat domain-containing protein [Sedimentisphaerales bacterium]|nr:HEAT repeat domain-containing protein [Sedimentisphaerales bacterium]
MNRYSIVIMVIFIGGLASISLSNEGEKTDKHLKQKARAITAAIKLLKDNVEDKKSFSDAMRSLGHIVGRSAGLGDVAYNESIPESIPKRKEVADEIEQWWQRNKDRSRPEWFGELFLNSKTIEERNRAFNNLRQTGNKSANESAVSYLVKAINKKGEEAIFYALALHLLSRFGNESAIHDIKEKLYHEDVYVRREAAIALHKLGDQNGVPIMITSLGAQCPNTRSVANAVLREITGQDYADGKSLRYLPPTEQKDIIRKWFIWWRQNKNTINADEIVGFSSVLKKDRNAMEKRYAAIKEAEENNPDLPKFDDPGNTPKAIFAKFKTELIAGNIEKALSYIIYYEKDKHREIFRQIGPHLSDYGKGLGDLYFDLQLNNMYYYEMPMETDEGIVSNPVHFYQGPDNSWRIKLF